MPPAEQFLNSYTVSTPASGFALNFINVVAPTASLSSVMLDGVVVPLASFTAIPGSTFSGAQLAVALGSHTLSGSQPFGVTVYGFAQFDSYGYPGGLSLAPVATVTSVALAPKTATNPINTEHCVTATVKDQNGDPVVGVRVDFTVTGVNPTSGFANTAADGTAKFCYTGFNAGDDSIQAAVGTINDTATKHWGGSNTISALGDVHAWIGLRNSDDQGTQFDLRVELLKNGTSVESGIKRCITGLTRNALSAKEALVAWDFSPVPVTSGDVLSVRFSARIGTNPDNTKCSGPGGSHNNAVGLRLYYDAASRNSRFAATIGANPSADLYLHSDGGACDKPAATMESQNVNNRVLNTVAPGAVPAKCKDSGVVNFAGGNAWSTIGTWSLAALP